jgi:hypothetical protein
MHSGNSARPALVLLSGVPGAGKTTFARALCAGGGFVHIESDAIRLQLFPAPEYSGREHARVFAVAGARARKAIEGGSRVIVDATNLARSDRRRFVDLAVRTGAVLVGVRMTAPDAVIRERLAGPRDGISQATVAVYDGMRHRAQPFTFPVVTVDSRFTVEPSVALVRRLIEEA